MREVLLVEAGAVVSHGEHAAGEVHLHRRPWRAPLRRVPQQVGHGARDPLRLAAHKCLLEIGLEADVVAGPPLGALHELLHHLVEAHIVLRLTALGAPRQLHHVRHQRRQLVQLAHDVGPHPLALLRRQALLVLHRLDVRPQAGDRRAQLVAGVGHQVALGLHGALERVQGGVEAAREPGQLVVAHHLHPLRRVEVARQLLGPAGEARYRHQRRARHERAQADAERDAHGAERDQRDQQVVELVVYLLQGPGHLNGAAPRQALCEQADVRAACALRGIDLLVGQLAALTVGRDLAGSIVHGQLDLGAGPAQHLPSGRHELGHSLGAAEGRVGRRRGSAATEWTTGPARATAAAGPALAHSLSPFGERVVDLPAQR